MDFSGSNSGEDVTVTPISTCANGAANNKTITVASPPNAAGAIIVGGDALPNCQGDNGVTYTVTNQAGVTFNWSVPTGFTIASGQGTNSITVNLAANATSGDVIVTPTNSCGSGVSSSESVTITPDASNAGTITGSTSVCDGDVEVYSIDAVSGASSYTWTIPTGASGTSTTNSISVDFSGSNSGEDVTVTPISTCANGAANNKTITVNGIPNGTIDVGGASTICNGTSTSLDFDLTTGNNTGWQLTYNDGGSPLTIAGITGGTKSISITPTTSTTYTLTQVQDGNGCIRNLADIETITVNQLPGNAGAFLTSTSPICQGTSNESFSIAAVANATSYSWTTPTGVTVDAPGNTNSVSIDFGSSASSGTVSVTPSNACGIGNAASMTVNVNPTPTAVVTGNNTICNGDSSLVTISFTAQTPWDYTFDGSVYTNDADNPKQIYVSPTTTTVYSVSLIQDGNGCDLAAGTGSATVTVNALPNANYSIAKLNFDITEDSTELIPGVTGGAFSGDGLISSGGKVYFSPVAAGVGNHTITYTITNANGCTNQSSQSITVTSSGLNIVSSTGRGNLYCYQHEDQDTLVGSQSGGTWLIDGLAPTGSNGLSTTGTDSIVYLQFTDLNAASTHSVQYSVGPVDAFYSVTIDSIGAIDFTFFGGDNDHCISVTDAVELESINNPSGGSGSFFALNTDLSPAVKDLGFNGLLRPNLVNNPVSDSVYYKYTSASGCVDTVARLATIFALPVVTFDMDPIYNVSEPEFTMNGAPVVGTYREIGGYIFGTDRFKPDSAGVGQHIITYSYTNANGCTNTATDTTEVVDGTANISGIDAVYCYDSGLDTLDGIPDPFNNNGYNGRFATHPGLRVLNTADSSVVELDITQFGPGKHALTFTYRGLNGSEITIVDSIEVDSIGTFVFTGLDTNYCEDEGQQTLTADVVIPTGGTYTWTSSTDLFPSISNQRQAFLFPSISGAKTQNDTVSVTYQSPLGCTRVYSDVVKIDTIPDVDFSLKSIFNISEPAAVLTGIPSGGTFKQNDTTITNFDPAVFGVGGPYNITYLYTDSRGCSNDTTIQASVVDGGGSIVGVEPNGVYCYDGGLDTLIGVPDANNNNGTPGRWEPNVFATAGSDSIIVFDPQVYRATGLDTLRYFYFNFDGSVEFEVAVRVQVDSIGAVSFSGLDTTHYCESISQIALATDQAGLLATGTGSYSGAQGILLTNPGQAALIPSIMLKNVQNVVTYTYTRDATGCQASVSDTAIIDTLPTPSFVINNVYSVTDDSVNLNETPVVASGGLFVGSGITSSKYFDPGKAGIGSHTITYQYTDPTTGCENSISRTTNVNNGLGFMVSTTRTTSEDNKIYCYGGSGDVLYATTLNGVGTGTFDFSGCGGCALIIDSTFSFDPTSAGAGDHTVIYNYVDGNSDPFSVVTILSVDSLGDIEFDGLNAAYCIDDPQLSIVAQNSTLTHTLNSGTAGAASFSSSSSGLFDAGTVALYDISTAGITGGSPHNVTLTYTAPTSGCTATETKPVTINALPVLSFNSLRTTYNITEAIDTLSASPGLGTFEGSGINSSDSTFNPTLAGIGNHIVYYSYTDSSGTGCSNTISDTIEVVNALGAILGIDTASENGSDYYNLYCYDAALDTLFGDTTGGDGSAGFFSGPGIDSVGLNTATFNPSAAGPGLHTVSFTYVNGQVSFEIQEEIEVDSIGVVDFIGLDAEYCADDEPATVVAITFGGGTNAFSGPGTGFSQNADGIIAQFEPQNIAPDSSYDVSFTFTALNGCQSSVSHSALIRPLPVLDFAIQDIYNLFGVEDSLEATPAGGTFDGPGISGSTFFPSLADTGNHSIQYQYTDANGCSNSLIKATFVTTANAVILGLPDYNNDLGVNVSCYEGGTSLLIGQSFNGGLPGNFLPAQGLDGSAYASDTALFDPVLAGEGFHQLTYRYLDTAGTLFDVDTTLYVDSIGTVSLIGLANNYCTDADSIEMTGIPGGGVFTGPGIIDSVSNYFNPLVADTGINAIRYTYTSAAGCSKSRTRNIQVHALPEASFAVDSQYCSNDPSVLLTGLPAGGDFEGPSLIDQGQTDVVQFSPNIGIVGEVVISYEYTDANACTNTAYDTIDVFAKPNLSLSGLETAYCLDNVSDTIVALNNGDTTNGGVIMGQGIYQEILNSGIALFTADSAGQGVHTVSLSYTDTNTCSDNISVPVTVNELPIVELLGLDTNVYCSDVGVLPLQGRPKIAVGTVPQFTINGSVTIADNVTFNPGLAQYSDTTVIIEYQFTDTEGCIDAVSDTVVIHPAPVVDFSISDNCIASPIEFRDSTESVDSLVSFSWNFDDSDNPTADTSTQQSPFYDYTNPGTRNIEFEVVTSEGCSALLTRVINFGTKPLADFDWTNECFLPGSQVQFINLTDTVSNVVDSYTWDFGDLSTATDTSAEKDPVYSYPMEDGYLVSLTISTPFGCFDTQEHTVFVRPYINQYPYSEDFESGQRGWVSESVDSVNSWGFGEPNGFAIQGASSGTNAWVTGLEDDHLSLEQSSVVGPCFDISSLQRPMIKMNVWYDMESRDGAVLQYTSDPTGQTWFNIGTLDDGGINWYNSFNIEGAPGNQSQGWTGTTSGWIEVRQSLDALLVDPQVDLTFVRFRVAFGSDGAGTNDGFAFDNVWIGERPRNMLLEHFTNTYADDVASKDAAINNLTDGDSDIIPIHYHTAISNSSTEKDPMNQVYSLAPAARVLYYGISDEPYSVLDGKVFRGPSTDLISNPNLIRTQSLTDPLFYLEVRSVIEQRELTVDVTAITDTTFEDDIQLRVAVVERNVTLSNPVNGQTQFKEVVRKMISTKSGEDALGTRLKADSYDTTNVGEKGAYRTMSYDVPDYIDLSEIRVVAFVQNEATNEVYQAVTDDTTETATAIFEPMLFKDKVVSFDLYPNPAQGLTYVMIHDVDQTSLGWKYEVFDELGVYQGGDDIRSGEKTVGIITSDLNDGVYHITIRKSNGELLGTSKLVIQH